MKPLHVIAAGFAAAGAVLVVRGVLAQRGGGGGASSSDSASPDPPVTVTVSPAEAALHRAMRPVILDAFRLAGQEATPAKVQYMSAVAWLETRYGTGWPANLAQAHNWGAVQCHTSKEGPATCIPHKDHTSGGEEFSVGFRAYPSDVEGAADVVKHVLKHRPRTFAALSESGLPSISRASLAMRREKYYGGICYNAIKSFGQSVANDSFAHPDASEGTKACERETVGQHTDVVLRNARAIAQTLGEPLALRRGTFDDAIAWWKKTTSNA